MLKVIICVIIGSTISLSTKTMNNDDEAICNSLGSNCEECISSASLCAWCVDPNYPSELPRCGLPENHLHKNNCSMLENPSSEIEIIENSPLTTKENLKVDRFVQIRPQKLKLKLRVGKPTEFNIRVVQAKSYPVDLYYLMDLSNSMSDDKDTIVKLGAKLAETIQAITDDFRIGFGSFVDKEVMPFISQVPDDNCQNDNCPKPYSFQHQMDLGRDPKKFQQNVQNAPISGNIDQPEGGFDALLQVIVCSEKIGWREKARRVIIFTTDMSFHIAMDGKLGGLVAPNDGLCHLNETGYYTHSILQDYPSIGQINYLAQKYSVNIIWAVSEDQLDLYRSLTDIVGGSTVGAISKNSSNIVELVKAQYESITTTIKMESNSSSNCLVQIKSVDCGDASDNICTDVELGNPVTFKVTATLKSCQKETFIISPIGLNEELLIDVEPICSCECEKQEFVNINDRCGNLECHGHGQLICGECSCCFNYFGDNCECVDTTGKIDKSNILSTCRQQFNITSENGTRGILNLPCSGRGDCVCGECKCHEARKGIIISGDYCEKVCNNNECFRDIDGVLCSGHGQCECQSCICEPPWTGLDCSCRQQPSECINPELSNKVCSGHGHCECDECICDDEGYHGKYCDLCETCMTVCAEIRQCVECLAGFQTNNDCSLKCHNFIYNELMTHLIPSTYENCTYNFKNCEYKYSIYDAKNSERHVILHLWPSDKDESGSKLFCPSDPSYLGIILGIIGTILMVGLLTIFLWKAFTTIHDKREFARFEAERQRIRLPAHSNPIFKQATTTVQNPTFNPKY